MKKTLAITICMLIAVSLALYPTRDFPSPIDTTSVVESTITAAQKSEEANGSLAESTNNIAATPRYNGYEDDIAMLGVYPADKTNKVNIPDNGTYFIDKGFLIKVLDNETTVISKTALPLKEGTVLGFPSSLLCYNEASDTLFLMAGTLSGEAYLYVFPDYNTSSVELIGTIKKADLGDGNFIYDDADGITWSYTKNSDGYNFDKIDYCWS